MCFVVERTITRRKKRVDFFFVFFFLKKAQELFFYVFVFFLYCNLTIETLVQVAIIDPEGEG
jgi:hypothetical protein